MGNNMSCFCGSNIEMEADRINNLISTANTGNMESCYQISVIYEQGYYAKDCVPPFLCGTNKCIYIERNEELAKFYRHKAIIFGHKEAIKRQNLIDEYNLKLVHIALRTQHLKD